MEEAVDGPLTHPMPLGLESRRQLGRTLACPPQERHRVPPGHRLNQGCQGLDEVGITRPLGLASPAWVAYPLGGSLGASRQDRAGEFLQASPDGGA